MYFELICIISTNCCLIQEKTLYVMFLVTLYNLEMHTYTEFIYKKYLQCYIVCVLAEYFRMYMYLSHLCRVTGESTINQHAQQNAQFSK